MAGGQLRLARGGVIAGLAAIALLAMASPWYLQAGEEDRPTVLYWYYGKWIPDLSALSGPPQKHAAAAASAKAGLHESDKKKSVGHVASHHPHRAPAVSAMAPATENQLKPAQPVKPSVVHPKPEVHSKVQPSHDAVKKHVASPKPALQTDSAEGTRKLEIDTTLRHLKDEARELGVNLGGKRKTKSTLDEWGNVDMPVPNLEPGVSTPELPFPPKSSPGSDEDRAAATQSLADYAIGKSVVVGPTEKASRASKMAAPAWSPYYLEPTRHPEVDTSAWKWAAALRQHRLAAKAKQNTQPAQQASQPSAPTPGAAKRASVSALAQVDSAAPCPWFGCADGSNAWFGAKPPQPPARTQLATQPAAPSTHALSVAEQILAQQPKQGGSAGREDAKQIAGAAAFEKPEEGEKLHLAHGFGTTNTYTADPITAEKNQYYGGEHRHFGSERPVTSNGKNAVSGKEAYANDMAPAYDIDEPSSFDSIPLASPSSFAARVAAHQPGGDGKLEEHHMRADVLAAWREYEHGLSQCMQAEATIDPSLKDFSCSDVREGLGYVRECMQNHRFGLEDMPLTRREKMRAKVFEAWGAEGPEARQGRLQNGAWGALPRLVQLSYQLQPADYKAVYSVLQQSAVFNALWRMERLHTRCAATGSAVEPGQSPRDKIRDIDSEIKFADRCMDLYGPATPEQRRGEAILQGANKGMPWEWSSVRRGARRNYWPHVRSQYPDPTTPNLPFGEYYGHENGYYPQPLHPRAPTRLELPRWRVPHSDAEAEEAAAHPLVDQGQPFEHPRPQPRARLDPDHQSPAAFPVNGKKVNPDYPRPWQVSSGAPDPWKWVYPPRRADVRPVYSCIDDWHCPHGSVCSTLGVCRVWEDTGLWHTPEAVWETNLTPDWV